MDVMSCIRGNKDKMKLDADVLSFRSAKMLQRKLAARERIGSYLCVKVYMLHL
jgi:hypothetical protein